MTFCTNMGKAHRMRPSDFGDPDADSSTSMRLTFVVLSEMSLQLLDMKLGLDSHVPHRMNCNQFNGG